MAAYLRIKGMLHPFGLLGEPTPCSFAVEQRSATCAADLGFVCACSQCSCCPAQPVDGARLLACWPLGANSSPRTASIAEYAEQELFFPLSLDFLYFEEDRLSKWQQLGRRHPKLEACILAANPSWQADLIPAK